MRAVVLVGGEGTRLRPLTLTTPKQMLRVVEVTMIERVLAHLAAHGVDDVVLSMGYRPAAFAAAFPDNRCAGVRLTYAVEPEPLDTAGAIGFAARHADVTETFLVANGDVLTDLDLGALVALHRARGAEATISLTPVEDPSAFGVVPTGPDGRVQAFIEKPPPGEAPTNFINAGFYVLEPSVLDRIPSDRRVSIERETFPALVEDQTLYALGSDAYWIDTGTPTALLRASFDLLSGARPGPRRRHGVEVPPASGICAGAVAPTARSCRRGSWATPPRGRPAPSTSGGRCERGRQRGRVVRRSVLNARRGGRGRRGRGLDRGATVPARGRLTVPGHGMVGESSRRRKLGRAVIAGGRSR